MRPLRSNSPDPEEIQMSTAINITLSLGKEKRDVAAYDHGNTLVVYGIEMWTSHGKKAHVGYALINKKEGHDYTMKDVISLGYHGMRGNGSGSMSKMRYVGFQNSI
jgi:hypothetical protein